MVTHVLPFGLGRVDLTRFKYCGKGTGRTSQKRVFASDRLRCVLDRSLYRITDCSQPGPVLGSIKPCECHCSGQSHVPNWQRSYCGYGYAPLSAADISAARVGRTRRATSCPSRSRTSVGQSLTRKLRPSGRPGPSSTLTWCHWGWSASTSASADWAARQGPHALGLRAQRHFLG